MKEIIRKIIIAVNVFGLSGCTNALVKNSSKSVSSANVTKKNEVTTSASPSATSTATPDIKAAETPAVQEETHENNVEGTYQIITYDDGEGNVQNFDENDGSILGSSSVALNSDGSCEFNMPGISGNGCTWKNAEIFVGGASLPFTISGNELSLKIDHETYTFRK